jgi:hypothetical protein
VPELLGRTEPRVFTPPKRELTPETSHGHAAIAFSEQMLQITLFDWQRWLLIHGLELNEDGTYRFRTVVVEVARQNGKSLMLLVLALWHLYALKSRQVIGTAQDLSRAEGSWKDAVALAESDEELAELIDRVYYGHPKELTILHPAQDGEPERVCEYRVAAATRRGARGFSGDLILMDELREHQSWDSWAAVANTMNARPKAQAWAFSNAPDALGIVLRYLRALAHRELGWPDGDEDVQGEILGTIEALPDFDDVPEVDFDTGFFEWSMPPGVPRNDPEGLMQANPACNHFEVTENCVTWKALISGLRTQPAHIAEAEICCRETTLGVGGPFPEGSWSDTFDDPEKPVTPDSKIIVCVEVSNRRDQTYITRTGLSDGGVAVTAVWEDRAGTDWVKDYLVENRKTFVTVVVRSAAGAPVGALLKEFLDAKLPVTEWKGAEIPAACSQIFDRLRDRTIRHLPHGALDMAATSAVEKLQPAGGWIVDQQNSPMDVAPLMAVIGGVWGLANAASVKVPRVQGWDIERLQQKAKEREERRATDKLEKRSREAGTPGGDGT